MDEKAVAANVRLYDSHAPLQHQSDRQQKRMREQGGAIQLKEYHNLIKKRLLERFATGADSLLDMCCGRGGDINKWFDCNIGRVKGLDISAMEIVEATRRFHQTKQKRRKHSTMEATFHHVTCLGTKELEWDCQYDVVTCMFAIHYFFVSEEAIQMFFKNVANAIKPGGYFIATFPSGKQVRRLLNQQEVFKSPMLHLRKHWKGKDPTKLFGEAFECAITDTVTRAENADEIVGSYEYLVYFNVMEALANQVNLKLVKHYGEPSLNALFKEADIASGFKHFKPNFGHDPHDIQEKSLRLASELYVATVFQMEEKETEKEKEEKPKAPNQQKGEGRDSAVPEPERKKLRKV